MKNKKINKTNNFYSYQLNSGVISGNNQILNDSKKYLSISKEMRTEYVEYIFSLNELFIKDDLIHNNSLSLFFLTDISNKRTEIYDTYQSICHLKIIKEKLEQNNIDTIILDEVSKNFFITIKSTFENKYNIKCIKSYDENNGTIKCTCGNNNKYCSDQFLRGVFDHIGLLLT